MSFATIVLALYPEMFPGPLGIRLADRIATQVIG